MAVFANLDATNRDNLEVIIEEMKNARVESGIPLFEAADRMGFSSSSVCNFEAGRYVSLHMLFRYAWFVRAFMSGESIHKIKTACERNASRIVEEDIDNDNLFVIQMLALVYVYVASVLIGGEGVSNEPVS